MTLDIQPETMRLSVQDDGPGVPEDLRERVFDRFFRRSLDMDNGCGLGLAIVADIAAAHGGHARCLPSGRGALFEVEIKG